MHDDTTATYPPINTLKRVADNIWIVDGPVIRFGMPWPKFPFPTRMTVVRLASGDLFVDSPTPITPPLRASIGYPWDGAIDTLPVAGSYMTEVEFFHRASRTLILTDLIENFEPDKVGSLFLRLLTRIGGVSPPHGGLPRDLRLTFTGQHEQGLKAAVETMLAWDPERVIFAHGRWHQAQGTAELRRAFKWLLE